MGVVHLNAHLFRQLVPIRVSSLLESRQDVLNRRRAQHVLLRQAQGFTFLGSITRVQHRHHLLRQVGRAHGGFVVGVVERRQVEVLDNRLRIPQTQRDAVLRVVSWNRGIVRDRGNLLPRHPLAFAVNFPVERNRVGDLRSRDFPRVASDQPVVREFALLPGRLIDALLEQTILVSHAVAPRRQGQSRDGIQKARG